MNHGPRPSGISTVPRLVALVFMPVAGGYFLSYFFRNVNALIGLGVAGGLMSAFMAFVLWFPRERLPRVNERRNPSSAMGPRMMPKKTDIADYTDQDIAELTWALNSTPRKCLGYKTPAEAFLENLKLVALEM